jgi:hypothetical protein
MRTELGKNNELRPLCLALCLWPFLWAFLWAFLCGLSLAGCQAGLCGFCWYTQRIDWSKETIRAEKTGNRQIYKIAKI